MFQWVTGCETDEINDDVRPHPGPLPYVFASLRRDRAETKGEGGQERGNRSPRFEPCDRLSYRASHGK